MTNTFVLKRFQAGAGATFGNEGAKMNPCPPCRRQPYRSLINKIYRGGFISKRNKRGKDRKREKMAGQKR